MCECEHTKLERQKAELAQQVREAYRLAWDAKHESLSSGIQPGDQRLFQPTMSPIISSFLEVAALEERLLKEHPLM